MEIAFKRRNISNNSEITISFRQNRAYGRMLRTVGIVSTLKTACIALGVLKAMETAFKRRNISNNNEIALSLSSESSMWSHFSHRSLCFDVETGVHSIRRVKSNGNSV